MKVLKLFIIATFASALVASMAHTPAVGGQSGPTEAPAAFDNQTNGFVPQGTDPSVPGTFVGDRAVFEKRDTVETGLGPVYNAQSCAECHQNPVTGGNSQIFELRAGHSGPDGTFVPAPGGSLIQSRAVDAQIQERVPDGPRIVFTDSVSSQISVMGFDGGQYGAVGNTPVVGTAPSFSPDGTKIAFYQNVGGNYDIFLMNNDGTDVRRLTTAAGGDFLPEWSPDGTKIAFTSERTGMYQIFTMNADGSGQTNISNSATRDAVPDWSPDGTRIVFLRAATNSPFKVWTMNSDGTAPLQVTTGPGQEDHVSWSPDGTMLAFSTNRDGNQEIYTVPSVGGPLTRLTNRPASDNTPDWAPDNSAIVFNSDSGSTSGRGRLWTVAPDGSNLSLLSAGFGHLASYSRDQGETVRTFRASPSLLGAGFVEAVNDTTLLSIRDGQPIPMRGTAVSVPLLEAPGQTRVGRFGWKASVASLLTFSAGAYLFEMGITSPLLPAEQTSLGRQVSQFDTVPDPEDTGGELGFGADVEAFTRFMRSLKAPPRDRRLVPDDATDPGSQFFDSLSCSVCHIRSVTTAPAGTLINAGTFAVPAALGDKVIHPFSDFLLHDVGTGDGIVETSGEFTRNKMRTAPLWGLRTRDRFMHDGGSASPPSNSGAQSFALNEAILRHAGQATASRTAYQALTPLQKAQLIKFLKSL